MNSKMLTDIKTDYDLCINEPDAYQRKVDAISALFSLKGTNRLNAANSPLYLYGKYETAPFVIFSLNPGRIRDISDEDVIAKKSWLIDRKMASFLI